LIMQRHTQNKMRMIRHWIFQLFFEEKTI